MTIFDDIRTATAAAESAYNTLATQDAADQAAAANAAARATADETTIAQLQQQLAAAQAEISALTARFPGDPGVGEIYVGTSEAGGDPSAREKAWGATVGAYRSYFQWNQNDQVVARAIRDLAAHRLPIISFKDSGRWANVASGADDALLVDLATKLEALKQPVWLCMHHEPVDDAATEGPATDFAAAYLRLQTVLPANVVLMPILQSAPFDPTVGGNPAALPQWLPEGTYDGVVGFDTYNHRYYVPSPGNKYRDPAMVLSFLDVARKTLGRPDLPIAIPEFGVRTDPANPGKAAQWLRDFVAQAQTKNVPAVCYFDSGLNVVDRGTPWSLDYAGDGTDGTERLNAYGPLVAAGAHLS